MFVITCNNQDYDTGGEYPIGFKNTKGEADIFCINAANELKEASKIKGFILFFYCSEAFKQSKSYNELTLLLGDSDSLVLEKSFYDYSIKFFVTSCNNEDIEVLLSLIREDFEASDFNYSINNGSFAEYKGFNDYSTFQVYETKELGGSIFR